jgi:hypothetical protein
MKELLKRHRLSTIFLILYSILWLIVIYWFWSGNANYPHSDGAGNGTLVMLLLLVIAVYTITLIIKLTISREADYLKILGIVYLPIGLFILYYIAGAIISK